MKKLDGYKKYKLKKFWQKKKAWIIGTGSFLLVGIIVLLIGFRMTGWSIIKWLQSPYAITCFVCLSVSLLIIGFLVIELIKQKLGEGDDEDGK